MRQCIERMFVLMLASLVATAAASSQDPAATVPSSLRGTAMASPASLRGTAADSAASFRGATAGQRALFLNSKAISDVSSRGIAAPDVSSLRETAAVLRSPQGWWMDEPVRLVQVNLPGHMAPSVDPIELVERIHEFPANVLMLNMGGIVANYPTALPYHVRNEHLPEGTDFFGDVLREAHERGIRVVGRFDFSRAQREVFEAHPEWFFKKADGSYVVDENGIYATCINAGYYRDYAFRILEEALTRYPVDGLFFNMFGDAPVNYYTGEVLGTCRSPENVDRFEEQYGRPIPDDYYDPDYREFMQRSSSEVAEAIGALIHRIRPDAAFMTYLRDEVDVIMDETAYARSANPPMWPYFASVNADRARSTHPDKMIFNLVINFTSFRHRFGSSPEAFTAASLYQNIAHGAAPAFTVLGTLDQADPRGLEAARRVFARHEASEELIARQRNAAKVVVVGRYHRDPAFRGIVQMLSELHIPYAVRDDLSFLDDPDRYDLVISTDGAGQEYVPYLNDGGRLLVTGTSAPEFEGFPSPIRYREAEEMDGSYWKVQRPGRFPSLEDVDLIPMQGPYVEYEFDAPLSLVPPATYAPPDVVAVDQHETERPGLLLLDYGAGGLAYVPWEMSDLYYTTGSPTYRALFSDLIDELLPTGRQIETNAHPLVEISLMHGPRSAGSAEVDEKTFIHLVNLTGWTGRNFHAPVPMRDIEVSVMGVYGEAVVLGVGDGTASTTSEHLAVSELDGYTTFVLPRLGDYAAVMLTK